MRVNRIDSPKMATSVEQVFTPQGLRLAETFQPYLASALIRAPMIRRARERRLGVTLTATYPLVTEVPMHGDPFPMSLWERAVLESLERIETLLRDKRVTPAPQLHELRQEQTRPGRSSNLLPLRRWAETNSVRPAHAYAMAREGHLPVIRLGRRIYIHVPSIETWLERGARQDDLVHFELGEGSSITRLRDDLEQRP